jgi:hypothetical protein
MLPTKAIPSSGLRSVLRNEAVTNCFVAIWTSLLAIGSSTEFCTAFGAFALTGSAESTMMSYEESDPRRPRFRRTRA